LGAESNFDFTSKSCLTITDGQIYVETDNTIGKEAVALIQNDADQPFVTLKSNNTSSWPDLHLANVGLLPALKGDGNNPVSPRNGTHGTWGWSFYCMILFEYEIPFTFPNEDVWICVYQPQSGE